MTDAAPDHGRRNSLCRWIKGVQTMLAVSDCPCVVTIIAAPHDAVWIRLVGAVEMGAEAALDEAIDRVRDLAPGSVEIDLAGVTFAGALLVHFLIGVHAAAPRASIYLHHAKPTIQFILTVTGVDQFVVLDGHRSPA